MLEELKKALKHGATLELRGFGTFEPRLRKGREKARNPKTGERLSVPEHYVAAFRAGRDLKSAMWELPVEKSE
jgi:integration host factor subunit beta